MKLLKNMLNRKRIALLCKLIFFCTFVMSTSPVYSVEDPSLSEVLQQDFKDFWTLDDAMKTPDELAFRVMCFMCATLWAVQISKGASDSTRYIAGVGFFTAFSPVVSYWYHVYFNKSCSLTREAINTGLFAFLLASPEKFSEFLVEVVLGTKSYQYKPCVIPAESVRHSLQSDGWNTGSIL